MTAMIKNAVAAGPIQPPRTTRTVLTAGATLQEDTATQPPRTTRTVFTARATLQEDTATCLVATRMQRQNRTTDMVMDMHRLDQVACTRRVTIMTLTLTSRAMVTVTVTATGEKRVITITTRVTRLTRVKYSYMVSRPNC